MNPNLCLGPSLREDMETRERAHRSFLLIFKVRRRTDGGVSHQSLNEMCENLWLSHKARGSFCHTPNDMLKGQYRSIQPTENNGAQSFAAFISFIFVCFLKKKNYKAF